MENTEKTVMSRTNTKTISFYNIIHQKVYNQFRITIPIDRHFCGSSHGWLIAVDEDKDCQVLLFNPFLTSSEILLPSLKHLPIDDDPCHDTHGSPSTYAYLRKAVLSADPISNPTDYVVMAIFGPMARLAFCRPGRDNEKWTLVEIEFDKQYRDVMYYNGMFLAINFFGTVVALDPEQGMKATAHTQIRPPPLPSRLAPTTRYLTESPSGDIWQIQRYVKTSAEDEVTGRSAYSTFNFRVFELIVYTDGILEWMELKNLGDRALFLGHNDTISICATDYPGCKPNSIYFTDDEMDYYYFKPWNGPHDLGIYYSLLSNVNPFNDFITLC